MGLVTLERTVPVTTPLDQQGQSAELLGLPQTKLELGTKLVGLAPALGHVVSGLFNYASRLKTDVGAVGEEGIRFSVESGDTWMYGNKADNNGTVALGELVTGMTHGLLLPKNMLLIPKLTLQNEVHQLIESDGYHQICVAHMRGFKYEPKKRGLADFITMNDFSINPFGKPREIQADQPSDAVVRYSHVARVYVGHVAALGMKLKILGAGKLQEHQFLAG